MRNTFATALLVTSSLAAFGASAPARADVVLGGGSTLAEPIYTKLFPTSPTYEYCGVGSGKGQAGFLGNDPTQFVLATLRSGQDASICLSITSANKPVVFGASDATLSSTQISSYNSTRLSTDGPLIQVPTFGTPVTVPVVNASVKANGGVTLTENDLCGIYAGQITDFSKTSAGTKLAAGQIKVAYRSDGSGTTFLLTQHLNAVCGTTANPNGAVFKNNAPTTTFANLFPSGFPAGSVFVAAKGSSGVQAVLTGGSANVGYLSPDYTAIAPNSPTYSKTLFVAAVLNGSTPFTPTSANTSAALATVNPTIPNTSAAASNPANWVPAVPNPSTGYPIVGYTTFDLATCYAKNIPAPQTSADNGSYIASFVGGLYTNPTTRATISSFGFVPLATSTGSLGAAVNAVFVTNSSYTVGSTAVGPWNLNINSSSHANATKCPSSVKGRGVN